jgi:ATP-dependent DNA helicase PIF1
VGQRVCTRPWLTVFLPPGIGLGKEDAATLVKKVRRNQVAKQRWLKTKCLIIDEVSMVDGELFDKLSQIGRQIRGNGRPWGGLQLIITGDFFQLPPVPEGGREAKFAFDAATWSTSIDHTIGLTQIFRQRDPVFANMLNEMRLGRIDAETIQAFRRLERALPTDDGIEATELFPTRHEVEAANSRKLMALEGEPHMFAATDSGRPDMRDRLLQNMMAPKQLVLKKGAQVMLIKNLDENMVNGTQGTVVGFVGPDEAGHGSDDESTKKSRKKIRGFANGESSALAPNVKYPLVEFHLANGTKQQILCEPHDWRVELPNGEIQASRLQVPLILAWALSIHKAQGQTLERVRVNLHRVFEKGQAYVALSRATSQEGLQVLGFQSAKVMAHPRVIEFYNRLYSVEQVMAKRSSILTGAAKPNAVATSLGNLAASAAASKSAGAASLATAAGRNSTRNTIQNMLASGEGKPAQAGARPVGARDKKTLAHAL